MNNTAHSRLPDEATATRFWWIRHAWVPEVAYQMYGNLDLDCDTSDGPLFQGIAARLPDDAVWVTSHLRRTRQTAEALIAGGARSGLPLLEDRRIAEMNFGKLNGRRHAELLAERTDSFAGFFPVAPETTPPEGENFTDMRARVSSFMQQTQAEHPGRDVVCVAHRGTILAALSHALQIPLNTSVAFVIDNVSLTQMTHYTNIPADGPQFRVADVGWLPG